MPSAKVLKSKQQFVTELSDKLKNSVSAVLVDYKGINVEDDTKMRKELREAGIDYFVVKNTLLKFAAKENGLDDLFPILKGTTSIAISTQDVVAPAKIIKKYVDELKDVISIKAGVIENKAADAKEMESLAKLPSKEVLIAQLLCGMNAPIAGMVNVLNGNIRGLVIALNQIAENKSA